MDGAFHTFSSISMTLPLFHFVAALFILHTSSPIHSLHFLSLIVFCYRLRAWEQLMAKRWKYNMPFMIIIYSCNKLAKIVVIALILRYLLVALTTSTPTLYCDVHSTWKRSRRMRVSKLLNIHKYEHYKFCIFLVFHSLELYSKRFPIAMRSLLNVKAPTISIF